MWVFLTSFCILCTFPKRKVIISGIKELCPTNCYPTDLFLCRHFVEHFHTKVLEFTSQKCYRCVTWGGIVI